ncbi:MAG: NUDIX hydrolase [Planctomycetota bacterium]|nr:NUDIX hydrolase [Planctomycetota bacterium]
MSPHSNPEIIATGRHLQLVHQNGWEYVVRHNASGVVAIAAITNENCMLLVEQFRPPVNANVIEIPAGLAGDIAGQEAESFAIAAQRELEEETGFRAKDLKQVAYFPSSAGLTNEAITVFIARDVVKVGDGGGDASENIIVHQVPVADINAWLKGKAAEGCLIDMKIHAGLYFLDIPRIAS